MTDLLRTCKDLFSAPLKSRNFILATDKAVVPEELITTLREDLESVVKTLEEYRKKLDEQCVHIKKQEIIILKIQADIELIRQSQIQVNQAVGGMIEAWKSLLKEKSENLEKLKA